MEEVSVLILTSQSGDFEGLYVNGYLVDQGHTIGEGYGRLFLLKVSEDFGFTSNDVREMEVEDEDEEYLSIHGSFPFRLNELNREY